MRVLVVGLGLIGKQRARALLAHREAKLVGTVDPIVGSSWVDVPHHETLSDVPAGSFDAAIVAVPHDVAASLAQRVLAQGKPVLIEKPLGTDRHTTQALVTAARQASLPCFVGYNYRFIEHVRRALDEAQRGQLGRLRSVDLFLGHGGSPNSAKGWKLDPARAGGGALIDPGVHLLDLALCLEPRLGLDAVRATRGFWDTGIEEDVSLILSHAEVLVSVRVSLLRWVNTFRVEIVGDEGYALLEGRGGNYGPLVLRRGKRWGWNDGRGLSQRESEQVDDFGTQDDSLARELDAVLAAWQGKEQPDTIRSASFEEAAKVAELCEAAYQRLGETSG